MSKNPARRNLANIKTHSRYQSKTKNLESVGEVRLDKTQSTIIHNQSFSKDNNQLKSFDKSPLNRNIFSQGGGVHANNHHGHVTDLNLSSTLQNTPSKNLNSMSNRLSS